jgi:hypothetical protein
MLKRVRMRNILSENTSSLLDRSRQPISLSVCRRYRRSPSKHARTWKAGFFALTCYPFLSHLDANPPSASCSARGDANGGARKPGPVVTNGSGSAYKKGKNGLKRGESEGKNFSFRCDLPLTLPQSRQRLRKHLPRSELDTRHQDPSEA